MKGAEFARPKLMSLNGYGFLMKVVLKACCTT